VLRDNVVDLAVGSVAGAAFGPVVKALVTDLVTPRNSMPGKADFELLSFSVNHSIFRYGDFANALLAYPAIAVAVFFFVVQPIEALSRRRSRRPGLAEPETKACPECLSTIPYRARRCAHRSAEVPDLDVAA